MKKLLLGVTLTLGSLSSLPAASLYWDSNGTTAGAGSTPTGTWGTSMFWNTDSTGVAAPGVTTTTSADDLFFVADPSATSGNSTYTVTLSGTQAANSITFQSSGAQTLSGGTAINLGAGGLVGSQFAYGSTARGTVTIGSAVALQASQSWINNGTNAMTVSGAVSGTANLALQNTSSGGFTISTGGINNTGTITNSGSGSGTTTISGVIGTNVTGVVQNSATSGLTLSGTNTFTTGVLVQAGTVTASNAAGFGTGTVNLDSGSSNSGISLGAVGGNVTNAVLVKSGSGTKTITNSSTSGRSFTGQLTLDSGAAVTISGGNLGGYTGKIVETNGTSGLVTLTGGANTFYFGNTASTFGGGVTLSAGTISLGSGSGGTGSFFGQGTLTINGGSFNQVGSAATVNGLTGIVLNADLNHANTALTFSNNINLGATGSATSRIINDTAVSSAPLTLSGVISDGTNGTTTGITKTGTGTLVLSGTNTYTGTTTIQAGTLQVNANAPSGSAGSLGNSTTSVLLGNTTGSSNATLQDGGAGTLTIARDIVVQAGNTGVATISSSVQGNTSSTYSGNIFLGSGGTGHNLTLAPTDFHTTSFSGIIQDPAGLSGPAGVLTIAAGSSSSTVRLSGTNTYTGGTVLSSGTLRINNLQALGLGALTINGGAISQSVAGAVTGLTGQTWAGNFSFSATAGAINLGTSSVTLTGSRTITLDNGSATVGGIISGSGFGLTLKGTQFTGNLFLNGANTFDGGTTVVGSTANFTVSSGTSSGLGTGQTSLGNSTTSRVSLAADTTVQSLNSGIAAPTVSAGGSGYTNGTQNLVFTGGGGSGAVGTATISGGAITSVSITSYGSGYTSAPTIALSSPGSGTGGSIVSNFGSSSFILNARTLTLSGGNSTPALYAGVLSGSGGSLVKNGSGTQELTGTSTYTGSTTVNGGTLLVSSAGSINGTSGVTVAGGALVYTSSVGLSKNVTVSGGTFRNNGANYTGTLAFTSGTLGGTNFAGVNLTGSNAIGTGKTLSPGNSPGDMATGSQEWLNGGSFLFEINDAAGAVATNWDHTTITGSLDLDALTSGGFTLQVASLDALNAAGLAQNFNSAGSYTWEFASFSSLVGTFDSSLFAVNTSAFANSFTGTFDVAQVGNTLVLNYTAVPEPSTCAMLALGAGALWFLRRKSRI
jgi:autotransporter-associated beta strand protein